MDEQFSPLIVQVQELSTKIAGVCATAVLQKIQINNALQVSIASSEPEFSKQPLSMPQKRVYTNFGKYNHPLRVRLNISNGSANSGGDPNYRLFFKQVFDPKTLTIAAFLTIYETAIWVIIC
ncbi:hypothetical protein DSO57_1012847 [Entomophthora muscae]|uniref:Uncharacterized protein n=1 Tax=Entomophthora muscae TaxID=34485 RepID=A0ACC2S8A2_9FUNG|nr:hypothetical protein DSO57_1012847 [Entomophthora muscae]